MKPASNIATAHLTFTILVQQKFHHEFLHGAAQLMIFTSGTQRIMELTPAIIPRFGSIDEALSCAKLVYPETSLHLQGYRTS